MSKKTASKPKSAAPVETAPARIEVPRAPAGSQPDPAAVEAIRELRPQLGAANRKVEAAQRNLAAASDQARPMILGRTPGSFSADTPLEEIWKAYKEANKDRREPATAFHDLREAFDAYTAAQEAYAEAVNAREALRKQTHQAVSGEAGKVDVALRERRDALQAQAQEALLPFVDTPEEAAELAGQTSKVRDLGIAYLNFWGYSASQDAGERAAAVVNACECLGLAPAAPAEAS